LSGAFGAIRTFPDECCFQVIYFNSNISFLHLIEAGLGPDAETVRLINAVKNAWEETGEPAFCWFV